MALYKSIIYKSVFDWLKVNERIEYKILSQFHSDVLFVMTSHDNTSSSAPSLTLFCQHLKLFSQSYHLS